ncbi:hypothetical protein [Hydrogenophaga sp.]|uniref:hypothetical protein n=1 Tax=Hydrogenophaga sp. TaxID=1904254 RepID=UPI0027209140|nr:hypothetical protein [Hydrogenophaga sp.]MDO8903959.1 hypothetical protein [Hydrogenophaga sp.]
MADLNLVFRRPRYTGGPIDLVFGGEAGGGGGEGSPVTATATIVMTMGAQLLAIYDNKNPRRVSTMAATPFQQAARIVGEPPMSWAQPDRITAEPRQPWQPARAVVAEPRKVWLTPGRILSQTAAPWGQGRHAETTRALVHQTALMFRSEARAPWGLGAARQAQVLMGFNVATPAHREVRMSMDAAHRLQALAVARFGSGTARAFSLRMPWQQARPIPPGLSLIPVDTGTTTPRVIDLNLVFACPAYAGGPVHLVFGRVCGIPGPVDPDAPLYILPARYYMAVHSLTAHILPGLTQIPIFDVALSADRGSFGWTFSASGPVDLFDALAPSSGLPAQIRITLDGIAFAFLVDGLQHEERFGRRGVRISGRSVTALLAAPYARDSARLSTEARTAQQLAVDALEFTGADLDWGLTDWLVSAGAWSHLGTPLAAVQAIVESAGGYLQSARNAATLLARHPYPELPGGISGGPWNWEGAFAADVELAPDALFVTSIERKDGPDLNAVYVSGTTQGVNAWVKRELSAGEKLAQPIADPLITANEAARQRGLSVVGAAGPKHIVQIEMPILTGLGQPGVLDVGQLVQINHASPWRGRVLSVGVNARMPKARQTVSLERHLEGV